MPHNICVDYVFDWHESQIWQNHFLNYKVRLDELDQNPNELLDFLSKLKSTRLGLRFEYLLWFWLLDEKYHHYQIIRHSVQVIAGAKTLGELDFVLFNKKTKKTEHWEVALKFYLYEATGWVGLNRDDTLYKKLTHFTKKQFQFKKIQDVTIDQKYAVLKGQLYVPFNKQISLPHWVNTNRRIGFWGTNILPNMYRLQRHEWIIPNQYPTSEAAYWWTDGLYSSVHQDLFYMYRLDTF